MVLLVRELLFYGCENKGTNSALALTWRMWGQTLGAPAYGSVAVFNYGEGKGHVGFIIGKKQGTCNIGKEGVKKYCSKCQVTNR
jgi:hypothetical protein